MKLYEKWLTTAYDKNGHSLPKLWNDYMPLEQAIYENMLETKNPSIKGTVAELAERYHMSAEFICGFIDGIKEALDKEIVIEELEETTEIDAAVNFTSLYKKMVEYKAEHLYSLPQWNNIFTEEQRKDFYKEQKQSSTVVRGDKVGRNDPCPCGSGKKYKKCCGAV